jgi:hypothetical protein
MLPHPEVQQLVAMKSIRRRAQVHRHVQGQLDRRLEQHQRGREGRP